MLDGCFHNRSGIRQYDKSTILIQVFNWLRPPSQTLDPMVVTLINPLIPVINFFW